MLHLQSAARHGVDVLSIDGFECEKRSDRALKYADTHKGAGHPGEEDIGGIVLVSLFLGMCINTSN